jgi:iron complex outermembrane receptor protein
VTGPPGDIGVTRLTPKSRLLTPRALWRVTRGVQFSRSTVRRLDLAWFEALQAAKGEQMNVRNLGWYVSAALLLPTSSPAQQTSQAAESAAADLEEVLVTARRRPELLQRVPDQITVFSEQDIADARISSFQDFADLTPNLQTFENFRRGVFNITVRGIPTVQGGEPPVTVLVDGVQTSGLDFVNQDLFDVQSIQVLRGPQGAIYGRGAIAGAILIETRQPGDEVEANVQSSWTDDIDETRVAGSLSGPIVKEKIAGRISGSYYDRGGFIRNSLAGGFCDFGEEKVIRGQLRFTPSESLTIDAKINYLDGHNWASCLATSTDADPFLDDGENFPDDLPRDFKQYDDREITETSLKFDWRLPIGTLVSASSYQDSQSFSPGDVDFGPVIQPVFFENPVGVEAWNTNLYLVSADHQRFDWIVGAFYQDRETNNQLRVGLAPLPLQPPFFLDSDQVDLSKAWAVFGEATFRPTDKFEVSASLRYDEDQRESRDRNVAGSDIEETFTALQPRGSISYFWSDDLTTYLSVGKGFRSGGFNSLADTIAVGLTDRMFDKETATNYEVGFKSTLLDGRMTLNGAVFHTTFENQQFYFVDVINVARIVLTLPETEINGAELEAIVRPVDRLELRGAFGLADGEITEGGQFGEDGAPSPNAHRYTVNLSGQYEFSLTDRMSLTPRVEYERRGPIYYDQFGDYRFPETDFVNASIAFGAEHWSVSAFGRNLTDERIPTFFGVNSGGPGVHQFLQNQPRTYGLELRVWL